ncbi:MAG: ChrR family anti-sigma-E factor [Pseudomonadales bacterium]|nr:ChrR family anti-sigma-E factor [Pseudomonadales bacterium]
MTRLHPNEQELMAYAAGNLSAGKLLCIATHIEYCEQCRADIKRLADMGGSFLETAETAPLSEDLFERIMSKAASLPEIKSGDQTAPSVAETATCRRAAGQPLKSLIPRPLMKLIPDGYDALPWKRLGKSLRITYLPVGDSQYEVSMQRIAPGGKVFEHGHRGEEVTIVLKGSFSDHEGCYQPGDFVVRNTEDQHEPVASSDTECICLSLLSEPIRFTGPLTRLMNPFLQVNK